MLYLVGGGGAAATEKCLKHKHRRIEKRIDKMCGARMHVKWRNGAVTETRREAEKTEKKKIEKKKYLKKMNGRQQREQSLTFEKRSTHSTFSIFFSLLLLLFFVLSNVCVCVQMLKQ